MNIYSEILRGVWLMEPGYAQRVYPLAQRILLGESIPAASIAGKQQNDGIKLHAVNSATPGVQSNTTPSNTVIAISQLIGPIFKYDTLCADGVKTKFANMQKADQDPNVMAHILQIDSGGGSGFAAKFMSDGLKTLDKPVFAFVEGFAASAAYWIASACDDICLSSGMDQLGSIGTYVSIQDFRKYYEMQGINIIDIYATKSKDKNSHYLKAVDGDTDEIQAMVNSYNDFFIKAIENNRADKLQTDNKYWGTGKMFFADQAVKAGLADRVMSFDSYVAFIVPELKPMGETPKGVNTIQNLKADGGYPKLFDYFRDSGL